MLIRTLLLMGMSWVLFAEATPIGVDLLANGGFEDELSGNWRPNNWAKNEAAFDRVTDFPHGGSYALKMAMTRITGLAALELIAPVKLNPGDLVELRFWLRGSANSGAMDFSLRPTSGPYRAFIPREFIILDDWTEYIVTFIVPEGIDPNKLGLFFNLKNVNTIYLDDVSVRRLPEKDISPARPGNLVKNGSFEAGRVHWSGDIRGIGGYRVDTLVGDNVFDFSIASPDAAAGARALAFTLPEKASFTLASAYFPVRYGHPVTIGFSVKSSTSARAVVGFGAGKTRPDWSLRTNFSMAGGAWERKSFTVVPKPSSSGSYILEFVFDTPREFMLDNVSVVEGDADIPDAAPAQREAGLMRTDTKHPGNVYYASEKIEFDLMTAASGDLDIVTLDAWDTVIDKRTIPAKDMTRLSFPSTRYGCFKIEIRERGGTKAISDTLYSVVPRLKPSSEVKDSFFGTHALFSDYSLDLCEKAGFRWLRTYPPHYTEWFLIEETPGDWLWLTNRVAIATARGFQILGLLNTTPVHEGDSDPGQKSTIWQPYAPKDWNTWRNYVRLAVSNFAPWIQHWVVWNEPDYAYLMLKKGVTDKADVYLRIVDESRAAIDEMGANVTLLGGAAANPVGSFFNDIVGKDIASRADGISHHWYYENASPDQMPEMPFTVQASERFGKMKSRAGKVPELWQTEGGIYLNGAKSWMTSWDIPPVSSYGVLDAANTLVRTVVAFKAAGYKRNFFYLFNAKPTGRCAYYDMCVGLNDVDGSPHPAFTAHAVAVSFIDEASPDGFVYPEIAGISKNSAFVGRFIKAGKRIDVLWSKKPVALKNFPAESWKSRAAFDMMGNPISANDATVVDSNPLYFVMR